MPFLMDSKLTSPISENVSAILRRVGVVLILAGILDVAWMFYVISSQKSYASSFNLFAVIAGILLYRQSLRAARLVSFLAAFFLAGFAGLLVVLPLIFPPGLISTYLRITPISSLVLQGGLMIVPLVLLWWVYRSLADSPVQAAIESAGLANRPFSNRLSGFWFGAALIAALGIYSLSFGHGETARQALERARAEKGPRYNYFVSVLSTSETSQHGTEVRATVLAYTENSIEKMKLEWRK
jgi:hypothetical protein